MTEIIPGLYRLYAAECQQCHEPELHRFGSRPERDQWISDHEAYTGHARIERSVHFKVTDELFRRL